MDQDQARMQELVRNHRAAKNYGNDETKCLVCGGTGFEHYLRPEAAYGGAMIEFVKKCSMCSARSRDEDLTGIPLEFKDADLEKFDFGTYSVNMEKVKKLVLSAVNSFDKWKAEGKGLFLWSKTPGSGKTFLSCCVARSIMLRHDLQMRFITVPDYISTIGDSYKREKGARDESEIFRSCKLLVLDDIGTQQGKEWQQQELFRIINQRMSESNITLFTANMPPEQLNLEKRTIDRIIKTSIVIQMPEESIRARKAESEQEMFLKEVAGV